MNLMKQMALIAAIWCVRNVSHAQLQIKPPGADTMSNAQMAHWYASQYHKILGLTDGQEKKVYKILLDNRNRADSLRKSSSTTTEELAKNTLAADERLKGVLTDAQYHDYLRTSQLYEWKSSK